MKNTLRIIASAAVSILLLFAPSHAQNKPAEPQYSATYNNCMKKADGATYDMGECNSAEIDRQEKALNDIYRKIMATWTGDDYKNKRDGLQKAERAWARVKELTSDLEDRY